MVIYTDLGTWLAAFEASYTKTFQSVALKADGLPDIQPTRLPSATKALVRLETGHPDWLDQQSELQGPIQQRSATSRF